MMFSSSPLDKSCVGLDNCSSGRHNSPNRFPVGITSLGDDNQQSRIQLAVHKYNSSANTALNSRCTLISPIRHNYLKTSLKAKNYEGDTESILKSEKKNGNQYEGVGAFPTIHLRKSAVRYRPIKKFNDVKIPYPELPVSRFLSHLPEVCSDLKSSTRSVLDVLEDLSGKKIHSRQDSTSNKVKSRGLGGDHLLNPNAVYKPLFVQKPKLSSVLTRDNTTQTLCPLNIEAPGPQLVNAFNKNDESDPRAELRRKLAKQNNEIFASLSSSISSCFALKRKIDKVLPVRDDEHLMDGAVTKKSKMSDYEPNNHNENDFSKPNRTKTILTDATKSIRNTKVNETNTPTSPPKDRLTTIFLDMQNTSPKSQIFQNQSTVTDKSVENDCQASTNLSNGFAHTPDKAEIKISSPLLNGSSATSASENGKVDSENISSAGLVEKNMSPDSKKPNSEQTNKPIFNFPICKAETIPNDVTKSTSPAFEFGINTSNSSNFSLQKSAEALKCNDTMSDTKIENNTEKKVTNQVLSTSFTFGKSNEKPAFGSFKLRMDENASKTLTALDTSPKDPKAQTPNVAPSVTSSTAVPQFSFVATTIQSNVSTTQTSNAQFGATNSQSSLSIPVKPTFTFGQIDPEKCKEKPALPNGFQVSNTAITQSVQPAVVNFDQHSLAKTIENQINTTTQPNTVSLSTSVTNTSGNSTLGTENSKSLFSFSQKNETPVSASPASNAEEQKVSFSFGQKSDAEQNKPHEGTSQKSTTLFSFGQKSTPQESSGPASSSPGQLASNQPTSAFGLNVTQPSPPLQVNFGKISKPQGTDGLGAKSETGFLGSASTPAFGQSNTAFPTKTPLFGSSMTGFGTPNTQASVGFGTSTTSSSGLGFGSPATTQSVSTPQSGLTFGVSSTPQPLSGFGGTSALQSTSAFGVSSTAQSTSAFGVPSTIQTTSSFGVSTNQATPAFAVSSSQSSNVFGAPASTVCFGAPVAATSSSGFGVTQPSFSQPLSNKPATSLGQTSNVFGQNPGSSFSSSTAFSSTQNSVFGQKPNKEGDVFDQNKIQAPSFGTQNKFSFGMSTSNSTGFTTSPPKTTAAPVFSFGGTTNGNTFTFGSNSSGTSNTQMPFAFKGPPSEPFKFGANNAKEEPSSGFAATSPAPFTFGGQMNSNAITEQKPSFSFGNTQASSTAPFNFGTTPSPSVFSFGGSTSASSGSSFNFGTPNPFGQTPNASPATPFAVPGTFSIGSGTSQSRPRAASRPRRRP